MHGIQDRGQHAEIDNSRPTASDKDKPAEIAVAGDEDTNLLLSDPKQFHILSLGQAPLDRRYDIMA